MKRITIEHISYFLPDQKITNDDLSEDIEGWTAEKIYRKTGIRERRCAKGELVSDLAQAAGKILFTESVFEPHDIDFLFLCTESPDYYLPPTACIVQDRLGLPLSCGALDYNLGCSGFVYGLALAKGMISSGEAETILLITSETYTKYIHSRDRSTRTLFGDGAAATLITADGTGPSLGKFVLGTDGKGFRNLIVPAGGMALPRSGETALEQADQHGNIRSADNLYMNGPEIFNFSLTTVPMAARMILEKENLSMDDIDLFVFHQSNQFMLETLRRAMQIPEERFYMDLETKGNTVSASIPIALRDALDEGRLSRGKKAMIIGFGVGYSWGATLLDWEC